MKRTTIVTVTSSAIISAGLTPVLRTVNDGNLTIVDTAPEGLSRTVSDRRPAIIITDACSTEAADLEHIRDAADFPLKIIGLVTSALPADYTRRWDDTISIYDTRDKIAETVRRNLPAEEADDKLKELSPREKEVIIGVVKGLSNKEIADHLNVSANTVMTHRRNIAAKLQIHSPAGLTIYAIVSNLVNLDEIKGKL